MPGSDCRNDAYLLKRSKLKRKSFIVSSRADDLFEKFEIGREKGRSGSGLPVTTPGVSAGAGASEYVALGALTGGEEVALICAVFMRFQSSKPRICIIHAIGPMFLESICDQFFGIAIELPFRRPLKCVVVSIGVDVVQHNVVTNDRSVVR
jgi:hypothetical protein